MSISGLEPHGRMNDKSIEPIKQCIKSIQPTKQCIKSIQPTKQYIKSFQSIKENFFLMKLIQSSKNT